MNLGLAPQVWFSWPGPISRAVHTHRATGVLLGRGVLVGWGLVVLVGCGEGVSVGGLVVAVGVGKGVSVGCGGIVAVGGIAVGSGAVGMGVLVGSTVGTGVGCRVAVGSGVREKSITVAVSVVTSAPQATAGSWPKAEAVRS